MAGTGLGPGEILTIGITMEATMGAVIMAAATMAGAIIMAEAAIMAEAITIKEKI
jgi:hypothetical protein